MARTWFERLRASIAERGRLWVRMPAGATPLDQAILLTRSLLSEKGEASGAAYARLLVDHLGTLTAEDRAAYLRHVATQFAPDPTRLAMAAEAYLADPGPLAASRLAEAAESPRQELLHRLNMAPQGTAMLVGLRAEVLEQRRREPALEPLESDLRHLMTSWFNRGFLDLRRIDWHTPAAILEKLITYEAVHAIDGWDDLRRRLAADRRCFAFFHPGLPDEPLIFVEVALVSGMAGAIGPLLRRDSIPGAAPGGKPDTAIFYSISNCQRGLRGISFGNFLIKQVVEDLRQDVPSLSRFATLSPMPGFRAWLDRQLGQGTRHLLRAEERVAIARFDPGHGAKGAFRRLLADPNWPNDPALAEALRAPLTRLAAEYLTGGGSAGPGDPVARFHLGNGARLERINWLANPGKRGMAESYGLMVNYLYDLDRIEANHEGFVRHGEVARSEAVADLLQRGHRGRPTLLPFRSRGPG